MFLHGYGVWATTMANRRLVSFSREGAKSKDAKVFSLRLCPFAALREVMAWVTASAKAKAKAKVVVPTVARSPDSANPVTYAGELLSKHFPLV